MDAVALTVPGACLTCAWYSRPVRLFCSELQLRSIVIQPVIVFRRCARIVLTSCFVRDIWYKRLSRFGMLVET